MNEYTNIDDFINRLDNVRKMGNSYRCACPVHHGEDRNLLVNIKDGQVFAYCFVCEANTYEVAKELRIEPEQRDKLPIPRYTKDQRMFDLYMIELCEEKGINNLTYSDRKKYRECKMRMENFNHAVRKWMDSE